MKPIRKRTYVKVGISLILVALAAAKVIEWSTVAQFTLSGY